MDSLHIILIMFGVMLSLVILGFEIYIVLGLISIIGILLFTGSIDITLSLLASTIMESLREYVFAVIPLFVLMGEFLARSGAAKDLYRIVNRGLSKVPGRLGVATIIGNTVFAAAVGVSIAAAATFTRIAYPEMKASGYKDSVSLGCIAGSACLGMLIPPSVLLIIYGMLTELSIGKLFAAGILPGLILASMFVLYFIFLATFRPSALGENPVDEQGSNTPLQKNEIIGGLGTTIVIFLVLGGIWFGWYTPTEAAGIGALLSFVLALLKRLNFQQIIASILHTGRISAPLLFLLIFGQLYARLLSLGGAVELMELAIASWGVDPVLLLVAMIGVWFVLGMFIDSTSIILLSVPVFAPVALLVGYDPLQFAIITILAIEAGILTPPLGLCVYTVKAAVNDPNVSLGVIFKGAVPYWIMLLILIVFLVIFPGIATYLPGKM